ncbi:hypothetical protein AeNC1_013340 [Aphanomyces euteiches]|nr:hypothetical protein AeNC1_013340 [Aphanomyces euteiches]
MLAGRHGQGDIIALFAAFQSMHSLSQQIVVRLLFSTPHVSKDALMHWIQDLAQSKMTAAIEKLRHLRVLRLEQETNKFGLNPAFGKKRKTDLSSLRGSPWEAKNFSP